VVKHNNGYINSYFHKRTNVSTLLHLPWLPRGLPSTERVHLIKTYAASRWRQRSLHFVAIAITLFPERHNAFYGLIFEVSMSFLCLTRNQHAKSEQGRLNDRYPHQQCLTLTTLYQSSSSWTL
jgi:hypothetical protein